MATISVSAEAYDSTKTYINAAGHMIVIDEPQAFGGEDTAPSPVAMLLASLAGCVNAIGQWVAGEMKFKINKLSVVIDGEVDATAFFTGNMEKRAGFSNISVNIKLDADITKEQKDTWLDNIIARCPVSDNLINGTTVKFDVN